MALSRGMTALRAALGAVGGGLEGYTQFQAMEQKRKREEEAANMQRDLFRLQLIQASGGRLAPPTEPVRAAAPAAPAMTMPSTDTVLQRVMARTQAQEFGPMATPATQAALEPGRRQALGMETPPLARTSLGELLDRQTGRVGMAGAMPTPTPMAEAAPAPVRLTSQPPAMPTPTRRRETLGGMEFELLTAADQKAQADAEFNRAIAGLSPEEQDIARMSRLLPSGVFEAVRKTRETKAEDQKAERMADLYVKTYVDAKGQPIPRDQALAAALNQKTPIDMGFIEKPMSNAEKIRISLDTARFNLSQKEYDLRLREQNRRESDSQRRRESMPVGAQRRLEGLDSGVLLVGDVREMLKSAPESIGPVKGRVFSSVLDAADKKGVAVRAAIESMAGEIRNQRFGAALTASEAKFAEQFLPGAKDSYETAMSKLDQLDRYLETKRKGVFMTYQQEYRPIYAPTGASPAAGGAANPYR